MPRYEKDVTIEDPDRDRGKVFHLREMSATQGERWAIRALQAAARAGVDIPEHVIAQGMAAVAAVGIRGLMASPFYELEPLLDEMFACITVKPDRANPDVSRALVEDDIEEIRTRITLRFEVLKLHTDFSQAGVPSK